MQPTVDSAPSKLSPSPAPATALVPGMTWLPAATAEWSGSVIRAAGGWLGTSEAFRAAARSAFKTESFDPTDYVLVCAPNENSLYLKDNGDERTVTLGDIRLLYAELDRAADGAGPEALSAHRAMMRITEHLAAHLLRIGTH